MIARDQEGIMSLINAVTGNIGPGAAAKSAPSAAGSFAGVLSSELRARSIDPATGKSISAAPCIGPKPSAGERIFSSDTVKQLINGPAQRHPANQIRESIANNHADHPAPAMIPGIVQLPVSVAPAAAKAEAGNKGTAPIDVASIVNFNSSGYKTAPKVNPIRNALGDNPCVVVGSRSSLNDSAWEKYRMESPAINKKGSSFLAGGVMISVKVPT
jgi:hypothetical protein